MTLTRTNVPGIPVNQLPYSSAAVSPGGDVCVSASEGGETRGGSIYIACRRAAGAWKTRRAALAFRYTQIRLFPGADGSVTFTGDRNTRWSSLGGSTPPAGDDYSSNSLAVWRLDMATGRNRQLNTFTQGQTATFPAPTVWTVDSFVDSAARIHLLYWVQGASTRGTPVLRHRVMASDGTDAVTLPVKGEYGTYDTMFEGPEGDLFVVHSGGAVGRFELSTATITTVLTLDLPNAPIEHAGISASVPRTGATATTPMELVYPTQSGTRWVSVRLGW